MTTHAAGGRRILSLPLVLLEYVVFHIGTKHAIQYREQWVEHDKKNPEDTTHTVSHDLAYGLDIRRRMLVVPHVVLGKRERKRPLGLLSGLRAADV